MGNTRPQDLVILNLLIILSLYPTWYYLSPGCHIFLGGGRRGAGGRVALHCFEVQTQVRIWEYELLTHDGVKKFRAMIGDELKRQSGAKILFKVDFASS